jgi:MOSC domain-containing protein YiiM
MKQESLGMKVIEGVSAEGFRSTRTIAAGEVGNEKPIEIVSEQWISSELKAVIYSKRSDPRTGDQIMQMTNIQRVEPPASLFTVPLDFKEAQDERGVIRMRANE